LIGSAFFRSFLGSDELAPLTGIRPALSDAGGTEKAKPCNASVSGAAINVALASSRHAAKMAALQRPRLRHYETLDAHLAYRSLTIP
jgi:hypothetical protein